MGEVYRARDRKLGRDVALKILPELFANDADRLARFQREAQILASLNHPNIAIIHGLEEADGIRALVLELVEGPTLAEHLAAEHLAHVGRALSGPPKMPDPIGSGLQVTEALAIARQIADALAAAHEHGVVHGDLKPANIKIRPDGAVKVLDFGLAKALDSTADLMRSTGGAGPEGPAYIASRSPTLTTPAMTGMGMIMGTAAYMSPEQAKGRPVDKRADIWAFGCVLYEMLTGRRAFEGDDVSDTLASVLKSDPDWSPLPADTPLPIRRLIRRCLTKDPKLRVPDIAIARYEIDETLAAHAVPSVESTDARQAPSRLRRWAPIAAAGVMSGIVVGFAVWVLGRAGPQPLVRLTATPPGAASVGGLLPDPDLVVSPDGRRIVYVGNASVGTSQLYVRALDQLDAKLMQGLDNPRSPFISPDGNWVAFFDGPALKKVAINGGLPVTICSVTGGPRGGSWGPDDTIVFATGDTSAGLLRVSARGGKAEPLTKPDAGKGELDHVLPEISPDGRAVLFTILPQGGLIENAQIAVLDLKTGQQKVLIKGGSNARYAPSGHIVYGVAGALRAVPFDVKSLEVGGDPVTLIEHVVTKGGTGAVNFSMAQNGTLVYLAGDVQGGTRTLVWVDRQGHEEAVGVPPRAYAYLALSPDGTRVALEVRDQENDVWVWNLARHGPLTRLTFDPGLNRGVVWSPDGHRISFSAQREGSENIYWQAADGTGAAERLTNGPRVQRPLSFTPDGLRLLFHEPDTAPHDLGVVNLTGDRRADLLLHGPQDEANGNLSPDGRWLAYESDESKQSEIYVRPFPNVDGGRWQVSTGGGTRPLWARNGRELFYWVGQQGAASGRVMAVPIQSGAPFLSGTPQAVVDGSYLAPQAGRSYDVSPDGKRFLVIKDATPASSSPAQLVVVLNWQEELKKLAPGK